MTVQASLDTEPSATIALPGDAAGRSVAAIVYDDKGYPDELFRQIVEACRAAGIATAGVLQHLSSPDINHRCDVSLEDLSSGYLTQLFEDRGPEACGCRLDSAALADATARVARGLDTGPGLLLLNKFGKSEAEGEGMLDLIAIAIDRGIPVLIGVPARNLAAWREFAGDFSIELTPDVASVRSWLARVQPLPVASAAMAEAINI